MGQLRNKLLALVAVRGRLEVNPPKRPKSVERMLVKLSDEGVLLRVYGETGEWYVLPRKL